MSILSSALKLKSTNIYQQSIVESVVAVGGWRRSRSAVIYNWLPSPSAKVIAWSPTFLREGVTPTSVIITYYLMRSYGCAARAAAYAGSLVSRWRADVHARFWSRIACNERFSGMFFEADHIRHTLGSCVGFSRNVTSRIDANREDWLQIHCDGRLFLMIRRAILQLLFVYTSIFIETSSTRWLTNVDTDCVMNLIQSVIVQIYLRQRMLTSFKYVATARSELYRRSKHIYVLCWSTFGAENWVSVAMRKTNNASLPA